MKEPLTSPSPVFRRKDASIPLDPGVVSALLNLLPDPAMVVQKNQALVYAANSAFFRLTSYSQSELSGRGLDSFLPGFDLKTFASGDKCHLDLVKRNDEQVPVQLQMSGLDRYGIWVILSMIPVSELRGDTEQVHEEIFQALFAILQMDNLSEPGRVFSEITAVVQHLCQTDLISLYQAESAVPSLTKVSSCEEEPMFPDQLPSTDLIQPDDVLLWKPGRRVYTEIHRVARMHDLSCVASIPLGQNGAWFGLLVVGDRQRVYEDRLVQVLRLIGVAASSLLQEIYLTQTLQQKVDDGKRLQLIRDTIVDNNRTGILVLHPDGTIDEMNPAAEWLLGYSQSEVHNQPVENVVIGTGRLAMAIASALKGIPTPNLGQVSLHRRSGQAFPAHVQVVPVMDGESVEAIILYLEDISEHEEIRARTQQLEQRAVLGEFTAMFAHEVRNPINNLSMGLQILATRLDENDPSQEIIKRMEDDCGRLNHLMEEVLAFSRPYEPHTESVDLVLLMKRLVDRWRPRMMRKNIELFMKADEELPPITGDLRALEQVFTNLISNAIEAMRDGGGTLAVVVQLNTTISSHPHIEVRVSDTGPGIPEEVRAHIFEPFVTTKSTGTGLGLAITKRIVTAHRGTIELNSYPGGTVFHVYLPIAEGE